MSTSPVSAGSPTPVSKPVPPKLGTDEAVAPRGARWQTYTTPILVVILALAVLITITRNWNAWEGGKVEQVTDDAYVRGDLTPLSTKVAGIVRAVDVADYQQVHKGDLLIELEDDDYRAQVDLANAAVAAARAGIEENVRQRQLQDARIDKALAGIDQANARKGSIRLGRLRNRASRLLWRRKAISRPSLPAVRPISIKRKLCCAAVNSLPRPSAAAKSSSNRRRCNFRLICVPSRRTLRSRR
jgi:hypothetical protein